MLKKEFLNSAASIWTIPIVESATLKLLEYKDSSLQDNTGKVYLDSH